MGRPSRAAVTPLLLSLLASATCEPVTLEVEGLARLRRTVIEDLLPARLPACVSDDEVEEIDRRLWTSGLFDQVSVTRDGGRLKVAVREKWTLIPAIDLATSRTLVDSFFFVSLIEGNFLGLGMEVGGYVMWSERSPSFELWASETQTAARRVTFEGGVSSVGSSIFFEDSEYTWNRRWWGGRFGARTPFWYGSQWRFGFGLDVSHERSTGEVAPGVRTEGVNVGTPVRASWDAYEWHDVVPHGTRFSVELTPTLFVTARDVTHRHGASMQLLHAAKFGERTALFLNAVAEVAWWGDPNNAMLLGNVSQWRSYGAVGGVRGLPDNLYRTAAQAFGTVELRRAFAFTSTVFLQPVVFVDGGVLARVDVTGQPVAGLPALSGGAGLRLVWTTLAGLVPRLDGGVLLLPQRNWFVTFGLSQYF
jgi:hypothetical protein